MPRGVGARRAAQLRAAGRRLLLPLAGQRARRRHGLHQPVHVEGARSHRPERGAPAALLDVPRGRSRGSAARRHSPTASRRACSVPAAIVLVGWWRAASPATGPGCIAAFLGAVYPMLWINDGMLISESMYVLVIAAGAARRVPAVGLALVARRRAPRRRDRPRRASPGPRPIMLVPFIGAAVPRSCSAPAICAAASSCSSLDRRSPASS